MVLIPRELAEKLKEAGFPQNVEYVYRGALVLSYHRDVPLPPDVRIPTLSELIETCIKLSSHGDFHLEHFKLGGNENWGAATCWKSADNAEWYHCSTPEGA